MPFPPTPSNIWDITQPPDTELANLLGQNLRDLKNDIMQRMSLLSGVFASRPTPEIVNATWGGTGFGIIFISTDTNQIFQWNGSAWVDITSSISSVVPPSVGGVDLVGQTAAIPILTTIYTPTKDGVCRFTGGFGMKVAGSSGTIQLDVGWNDGLARQTTLGTTPVNSLGSMSFNWSFWQVAGQAIKYLVQYNIVGGVPSWDLHLRIEQLG